MTRSPWVSPFDAVRVFSRQPITVRLALMPLRALGRRGGIEHSAQPSPTRNEQVKGSSPFSGSIAAPSFTTRSS